MTDAVTEALAFCFSCKGQDPQLLQLQCIFFLYNNCLNHQIFGPYDKCLCFGVLLHWQTLPLAPAIWSW